MRTLGDGGGSNDPADNAQDLGSLLGKLLRIDPTGELPGEYLIPAGDPFADGPGPNADEIYAYGLRNPYRFSFDRSTGDLTIGDVGQAAWEEIDFTPAGGALGANFGWDCFEGTALGASSGQPQCNPMMGVHTPPILQYANPPGSGAAVNGGYVVQAATDAARTPAGPGPRSSWSPSIRSATGARTSGGSGRSAEHLGAQRAIGTFSGPLPRKVSRKLRITSSTLSLYSGQSTRFCQAVTATAYSGGFVA